MNSFTLVLQVSITGLFLANICYSDDSKGHFTHEWAVNIKGGERKAKLIAKDYGFQFIDTIMPDYYLLRHNSVSKRSIYPSKYYHKTLAQEKEVIWLEQQVAKKRVKRFIDQKHTEFNDPKWPKMWYFNRGNGLDMNVQKAWAMGITGKGVSVTILDDGIEIHHPDLIQNYDEKASKDVNNHDDDPTPRYDFTNENRHGTRCAGEVAAQANNSMCSVGAAYDARIGGVRMLDGDVTDSVESASLRHNLQHVQIYSASWGPDDDGRTVDGPATLARKAFYDGINLGRAGLGAIYVWASGNGGRDNDSCNCDGYTNSIYTLSISSVTEHGNVPWYSEACSSTLATTYSSGSGGEKQIVTTDIHEGCTETHTGTSASAPLAAGLCALALQANPMLTWRDLQHIVVMTSKPDKLNCDWTKNGVGRAVSHAFGYGLMDAEAMVKLARNWTTVPPQHICEIRSNETNKPIPMNGKITVKLTTNGCEGMDNHVKYLEHVQARITLKASRRGDLQIYLTSPMGTRSTLLAKRSQDASREGFNNWAFMTTHSWGERAEGTWLLSIENAAHSSELKEWSLIVMGTAAHPQTQNVTQRQKSEQPFTCSGLSSNGVCIECRPGYYKLKEGCVANCPEHYFGVMQMVQVRSTTNTSSHSRPNYQRQGICNQCHEACKTCKGPQVADCFQCTDGYEKRDGHCQKKLLLNFLDPDMLGFFIWVIVLCIAAILLFGVIFGLLQARDRRLLCWKGKRHLDTGKCEYNGINLTQEELENDLQNFDIIRNRNFRHASIPESHDPMCRVHVNNFENHFNGGHNSSNSTFTYSRTDNKVSRNNLENHIKRNSYEDERGIVHENSMLVTGSRYNRPPSRHSSNKSPSRKHTNSYVSYDINSSLTKTLGKDVSHPLSPTRTPGQYSVIGNRGSGSLRH